jgi:hypothetical protein
MENQKLYIYGAGSKFTLSEGDQPHVSGVLDLFQDIYKTFNVSLFLFYSEKHARFEIRDLQAGDLLWFAGNRLYDCLNFLLGFQSGMVRALRSTWRPEND